MLHVTSIRSESALYVRLKNQLQAAHENLDEQTLHDTLAGATSLPEVLTAAVRALLDDQAQHEGLKNRLANLKVRQNRIETRISSTRALIAAAMKESELTKIVESDFTLSLRDSSRPLLLSDVQAIPDKYWTPQKPKLERQLLRNQLTAGKSIPGAELGNPVPTISVRVR